MKNRYKLEFEIYGDKEGIEYLQHEVCSILVNTRYEYDNFCCDKHKSSFNPKKFFKMVKEVTAKFYSRTK